MRVTIRIEHQNEAHVHFRMWVNWGLIHSRDNLLCLSVEEFKEFCTKLGAKDESQKDIQPKY